jgi:Tol biopolymer transport system component
MSLRHAIRRGALLFSALAIVTGITSLPAAAVGNSPPHALTSVAQRSTAQTAAATSGPDLYYILAAAGSSPNSYIVQQQTDGKAIRLVDLGDNGSDTPAISPNGRRIAFTMADCHVPGSANSCSGQAGESNVIVVMNIDGTGEHIVSPVSLTISDFAYSPCWSPDGKWIYFAQYSSLYGTGIYKAHPDGSGLTRVINDGGDPDADYEYFSLSPDGTKIAYDAGASFPAQLYTANINGSGATRVPNQPSNINNQEPVWTPDGKTLVFVTGEYSSTTDNNVAVDRINTDGSGLTRLATQVTNADIGGIALSPDGNTVAVSNVNYSNIYTVPISGSQDKTYVAQTSDPNYALIDPAYGPPTTQPTKTIVALGDSVAAGEGIDYGFVWDNKHHKWVQGSDNPVWRNTTASLGENYQGCHQSGESYADLLANSTYQVFNMACTGATAKSGVLTKYSNAPAQLGGTCHGCAAPNKLYDQADPDVVTLTLGADDIHFSKWIATCYSPITGACNKTKNTTELNGDLAEARGNLRLVLNELNRRAGLDKKKVLVAVTNYYDPYQAKYVKCADTLGSLAQGTNPKTGITPGEQSWIVSGLNKLNENIAAEVKYAQTHDSHLTVRLADISKVMAAGPGHQFCTADPWVYGVSIDYPPTGGTRAGTNPAPMHPTPEGQVHISEVVEATIAR